MIATALLALAMVAVPPLPKSYVTDPANVLSDDKANHLEDELHAFEQKTGDYVIVWIGSSTGNVPIDTWTAQATNAWKIGRTYDDTGGAVLFVFTDAKRVHIVTTGDATKLTAARAAQIADGTIRPALVAGHADTGIQAGIDAMLRAIDAPEPVPAAQAAAAATVIAAAARTNPRAALSDLAPASGPLAAIPPFPDAAVTDRSGALPATEVATKTQELALFEKRTSYRMVVWIGNAPAGERIESWTDRVWDAWRAHARTRPLGGILFVFPDRKTARLECDWQFFDKAEAASEVNEAVVERLASGPLDTAVAVGLNDVLGLMYIHAKPLDTDRPFDDYERKTAKQTPLDRAGDIVLGVIAAIFFPLLAIGLVMMVVVTIVRRGHRHGDWLDLFLMSSEMGPSDWALYRGHSHDGIGGGGGGGGFSGGGGSFGGGGASGGW